MSSSDESDDEPRRNVQADDSASDSDTGRPQARVNDSASSDEDEAPRARNNLASSDESDDEPISRKPAQANSASDDSDVEKVAKEQSDDPMSGSDDDTQKGQKRPADSDAETDESADEKPKKKKKWNPADFEDGMAEEDSEDDENNLRKTKKSKKKKKVLDDSDDDESDSEEGDLEDLIDDGEVEEDGERRKKKKKKKRRDGDDKLDDKLDDDDFDLINENLGINVNRRQKLNRVVMDSDDEDDANEDMDDRDRIQRDIFDETLGSDEDQPMEPRRPRREKDNFDSESESDNENNFIVDDQGNPIYQNKKSKNGNVYVDENLREAANIFDIDPTQLGEMFEDFENEYGEYDEDEPRPVKQKKSKKALTDLYEPDELERRGYNDEATAIIDEDRPERFQTRGDGQCPVKYINYDDVQADSEAIENELELEARWILENAFNSSISNQEFEDPMYRQEVKQLPEWKKKPRDGEEPEPEPEKMPTVYASPYPKKRIDDAAKVFLKYKDYEGLRDHDDREQRLKYILEYGRKYNTFLYKIYKALYNFRVGEGISNGLTVLEPAFIYKYRQEQILQWDLVGKYVKDEFGISLKDYRFERESDFISGNDGWDSHAATQGDSWGNPESMRAPGGWGDAPASPVAAGWDNNDATENSSGWDKSGSTPASSSGWDKEPSEAASSGWDKEAPAASNSGWDKENAGGNSSGWDKEAPAASSSGWEKGDSGATNGGWDKEDSGTNKSGWDKANAGASNSGWDKGDSGATNRGWKTPENSSSGWNTSEADKENAGENPWGNKPRESFGGSSARAMDTSMASTSNRPRLGRINRQMKIGDVDHKTQFLNEEELERVNKERRELGDEDITFDELLWYRKEKKGEDGDDRERVPECEYPHEIFQTDLPNVNEARLNYIDTEQSLDFFDLHRILRYDEHYMKFSQKKTKLHKLFQNMLNFQYDESQSEDFKVYRSLEPAYVSKVEECNTQNELDDYFQFFQLHFGRDVQKMNQKNRNEDEDYNAGDTKNMKQAQRNSNYNLCMKNKLGEVAKKFGLTPEEFADHVKCDFQNHEVNQCDEEPEEFATMYCTAQFDTADKVLRGARFVAAQQMAVEPEVRKAVRRSFFEKACISTTLTKKGERAIDEDHPLYRLRFLSNKPIKKLKGAEFIHLKNGGDDKLIELEIGLEKRPSTRFTDQDGNGMILDDIEEDLFDLYNKDLNDDLTVKWNTQRQMLIQEMLNNILYPAFIQKLKLKLIEEAEEGIYEFARRKFRAIASTGPCIPLNKDDDNDDDYDQENLLLCLHASDRIEVPTFGVMLKEDGEIHMYRKFNRIMAPAMRENHPHHQSMKRDIDQLKQILSRYRPYAIILAATSMKSRNLMTLVRRVTEELHMEENGYQIPLIEYRDPMVSRVYSVAKFAQETFPDYPEELRLAISLGRYALDPAIEISQLFNPDDDILCLNLSPDQYLLKDRRTKDLLLKALQEEMQKVVCDIGVDINQAIALDHHSQLLQFLPGLGRRKADAFLKDYRRQNIRIEHRQKILGVNDDQVRSIGPTVFVNCVGFIRLNTSELGDAEEYVDVFDSTRIHPESFEYGRKMCKDLACQVEVDMDEDEYENEEYRAVNKVMGKPEYLQGLDLEAFNADLITLNHNEGNYTIVNKICTLYQLKKEIGTPFKDNRKPPRQIHSDELFYLLTGETAETIFLQKMVTGTVQRFLYQDMKNKDGQMKSQNDDLKDPERVEGTDCWMCPWCKRKDFTELSQVWTHFDTLDSFDKCPGELWAVSIKLDNGLSALVDRYSISSRDEGYVDDPTTRMKLDQVVRGRIKNINFEKFQMRLTTKSTDLQQMSFGPTSKEQDKHLDKDKMDMVLAQFQNKKKKAENQSQYTKRVIAHESFMNISYGDAILKLQSMDQGECIIRPSSKGSDFISATWKVHDNIYSQITIHEKNKINNYTLGEKLLINGEEFEDLDEVIARYVGPMASNARDLIEHKYFRDIGGSRKEAEALCKEAKRADAKKIPYFLSACRKDTCGPAEVEGKFMLSFLPSSNSSVKHEYITALPDGFRYRQIVHSTTATLFQYFKENYLKRPPAPVRRDPKQGLAEIVNSLNRQQLKELKGGAYTPSDPFDESPRKPTLQRVDDDGFKKPSLLRRVEDDGDSWGRSNRSGGDRSRGSEKSSWNDRGSDRYGDRGSDRGDRRGGGRGGGRGRGRGRGDFGGRRDGGDRRDRDSGSWGGRDRGDRSRDDRSSGRQPSWNSSSDRDSREPSPWGGNRDKRPESSPWGGSDTSGRDRGGNDGGKSPWAARDASGGGKSPWASGDARREGGNSWNAPRTPRGDEGSWGGNRTPRGGRTPRGDQTPRGDRTPSNSWGSNPTPQSDSSGWGSKSSRTPSKSAWGAKNPAANAGSWGSKSPARADAGGWGNKSPTRSSGGWGNKPQKKNRSDGWSDAGTAGDGSPERNTKSGW